MTYSTLEVHSLINIRGEKWLVIKNNKFKKLRIAQGGRVLWRCTKTKYCPARVLTSNFEDNIVKWAKLKHDHSKNPILSINKRLGHKKSTISSQENLRENMEGTKAKEIISLNKVITIKKEQETDEEVPKKFSSSESAPDNMNLSEIIFPYMLPKDKVEIVRGTGVFISESGLDFIKEKLKHAQLSIIRNVLRHLLGPENLKYLNIAGDGETGTITMPDKVFIALLLFLTQNSSKESNHLSINCFIQCIKETFETARVDARFAESQKNLTDYVSRKNVTNDNTKSMNKILRNRRRRLKQKKSAINSTNKISSSTVNSSSICKPQKSAKATKNSNNSTANNSTNRRKHRQIGNYSTNNSNNATIYNSNNATNNNSNNATTNNSKNATTNNSINRHKRRRSVDNSTNNSNNATTHNSRNRRKRRTSSNNSTNNSNNATVNNSKNRRKRRKSLNNSINSNNSTVNNYTTRSKRRKLSAGEFYSDDQINSGYIPSDLEIYARSVYSSYYNYYNKRADLRREMRVWD
ncbi:putative uncharacterized protein DDB_G0286901 [Belonocnema kinseyi]|uniref:putative uncharacterized protein DDB_G0286901 n=1 Tax=Belonocnema kinseyi TaxID=2817044 RepID=UPI00143DC46D|nr:putative uncharacterized protein DDB_G0286901 [Belonocnema kinseyi]